MRDDLVARQYSIVKELSAINGQKSYSGIPDYDYRPLTLLCFAASGRSSGSEQLQLRWWAWVDSNYRPRPYQGRALTN